MNLTSTSKIDRLIAEHQRILDALKLTRDLLHREATTKKKNDTNTALAAALTHEAARSRQRQPKPPRIGRKIRDQRARSKAFLAKFDVDEPRQFNTAGFGSLVRRGYLKRKGDGYVRTAKEYLVRPVR